MKVSKPFQFKQFSIEQHGCGMPVSTDGVLLGAWAKVHGRILDIGTGTGLLSLMCAQRHPNSQITAIELDEGAYQAALKNVAASAWQQQIQVIHADILSHPFQSAFDSIICNPPYFNAGESSKVQARATARHTNTLSHSDLLKACAKLLTSDGDANFILPKVEGENFIEIATQLGFYVRQRCEIHSTEQKPCQRLLICLNKVKSAQKEAQATETTKLIIQENQKYTADFVQLTRDFYLKMS